MAGASAAFLRAGAVEAASTAARHAEEADERRVLHPDVVKSLVAAGFARHLVPTRWGGCDGAVLELLDALALVGAGCAAAAWCAAVTAGAARMGAYLPEQGQAELWSDGPDAFVVGALQPAGTARLDHRGWLLRGEWAFTSGVDFADWALVAADIGGQAEPQPWFFAVPRADFTITDTWFSTGMRGTGSNTLVLDGVFVPPHRAFDRAELMRGRPVGSAAACHRVPHRAISGVLFASPALGAARGAHRSWARRITEGGGWPGGSPTRRAAAHLTAARVAGEIDIAELLLRRAAAVCDSGPVHPAETLRNAHDCALAADRLVGAVETLFRTAGSRGQLMNSALQRFWRDVHSLASHVALQLEPSAGAYGEFLLDGGLPA